jgi:hypothetical protein
MSNRIIQFLTAAVCIGIVAAVNGCIVVRQSGAHDTVIHIVGDSNGLSMQAHRENSSQDAKSDPKLEPKTTLEIPLNKNGL